MLLTSMVDGVILYSTRAVYKRKGGIYINQIFLNLDPVKQIKIRNAAFQEFAEKGYEKASTNRIVKEAGIGKGMLFYYFNSKKELYHYLIEYGIDFIIEKYLNQIDEKETDFLNKYKKVSQIKLEAYSENPYIFNFLGTVYINQDEFPNELIGRLMEIRNLGFSKMYQNIDTSLFREDIPSDMIIKLIRWTMDGYEKDLLSRFKGEKISSVDMNPLWDEFYSYLDVMRKIYYK